MKKIFGVLLLLVCVVTGVAHADADRPVVRAGDEPVVWEGTSSPIPQPVFADQFCLLGPEDPRCVNHPFDVDAEDAILLRARLTWDRTADLDLVLFDADGNRLGVSAGTDSVEEIEVELGPGTYVLSVVTWFPDPPTEFTLTASASV